MQTIEEMKRKNKIINLQQKYEKGQIKEEDLTNQEKSELIELYEEQIETAKQNIEEEKRKLESYKQQLLKKLNKKG